MTELTSRENAFLLNTALGRAIVDIQQAEYQGLKSELDVADLREYELRLDDPNEVTTDAQFSGRLVIAVAGSGFERLLLSFLDLLERLGTTSLIFIPEFRDAWLRQKNSYPPVKTALKHIKGIVGREDYDEAIIVTGPDIAELFLSVFWISRCNAGMCPIYFSGIGGSQIFSLCKYGNVHIECYGNGEIDKLISVLPGSGFNISNDCHDILSESGIEGRQIPI